MKKQALTFLLTATFILSMVAGKVSAASPGVVFFDEPVAVIPAVSFEALDGADAGPGEYLGRNDVLIWKNEKGRIKALFSVPQDGDYFFLLEYAPLPGKGLPIQVHLNALKALQES